VSADSRRWPLPLTRPGGLVRPAALALVSVVLLGVLAPSWSVATLILIYALAALGCNLLLGYTGLLSVGQSVYFGVGGYTAAIVATRWDLQLSSALIISALLCAAVAAFIGAFAIRRLGIYFVMITFAFAETAHFLAYVFKDYTGGENGISGVPLGSFGGFGQSFFIATPGLLFYCMMAVLFFVLFVVLQRFVDSPVGAVLVAIRENEARAEAMGYSVKAYKLLAFMVSGAVTGIADGDHDRHHHGARGHQVPVRVLPGCARVRRPEHLPVRPLALLGATAGGRADRHRPVLQGRFAGCAVCTRQPRHETSGAEGDRGSGPRRRGGERRCQPLRSMQSLPS
jgi:ABC-type uncharacterized transport system permease subunit